MRVSVEIEPETGIAVATCSGVCRASDAMQSAGLVWENATWGGKAVVWDLRAAYIEMPSEEIRELAQFILGRQPANPPERVALVTSSDFEYGLTRMYQVFRDHPATQVRAFRDMDKALAWARSQVSTDRS